MAGLAEAQADPANRSMLWDCRRGPSRSLVIWTLILAAIVTGANMAFVHLLFGPASWWLGLGLGLFLGALLPAHVLRGARCRVDTNGCLSYGYRDRLHLELPLAAVTGLRPIEAGLLRGVGLEIDPQLVRFIGHRGPSYATMQAWRRDLDCDLVLEFLLPEDVGTLRALQARCGAAPPDRDRGSRTPPVWAQGP